MSLLPRNRRLEFACGMLPNPKPEHRLDRRFAWTALPDRIAAERGFFEKEGLKVHYIQFQGTNLMLSALLANELDYVTILPFIAGAAIRGLPVKIVGTTTKASGYAIISRPDIDSVKDLKGKRIAINTFGSSADFAIYQLLSRNGLDPNKDVTLQAVAGSPDARFAALLGGSVDATVVNSPFEYRAEQRVSRLCSRYGGRRVCPHPHRRPEHHATQDRREPDEIVRVLRGHTRQFCFFKVKRKSASACSKSCLSSTTPRPNDFTPSIAINIIRI